MADVLRRLTSVGGCAILGITEECRKFRRNRIVKQRKYSELCALWGGVSPFASAAFCGLFYVR